MISLITAANGAVPGELSLAHIATTYLPADFYFRLSRLLRSNDRALHFLIGFDVCGRRAERVVEEKRVSIVDLRQLFGAPFFRELGQMGVEPTESVFADDERVPRLTLHIIRNLHAANLLTRERSWNLYCAVCAKYLAKSEVALDQAGRLIPLKVASSSSLSSSKAHLLCRVCGSRASLNETYQWFLNLPRERWLARLHERQVSKTTRKILRGLYAGSFKKWEFTRDGYLGSIMPLEKEKFLYLWWDSLVSKFVGLGDDPAACAKRLQETTVTCFFGKGIIGYYGLVLPFLLRYGLGVAEPDLQLQARGIVFSRDGDKFFRISNALTVSSSDEWRFYCAYHTPDDALDFSLGEESRNVTVSKVLRGTFMAFMDIGMRFVTAWWKEDASDTAQIWPTGSSRLYQEIGRLHASGKLRGILLLLEEEVRSALKILRDVNASDVGRELKAHVLEVFVVTFSIMSCLTPGLVSNEGFNANGDGLLFPGMSSAETSEHL